MVNPTKSPVAAADAVTRFLRDIDGRVGKIYGPFEERLRASLQETTMDFEEVKRLFEVQPVRLYVFCAVTAIEAAKIRSLYDAETADMLLTHIGEHIGDAAGVEDETAADLMFDFISRIMVAEVDDTKKPHDLAMKKIAELLRLTSMDSTKDMTRDIVFRQTMGEPLALATVHWWKSFKSLYRVVDTPVADKAEKADLTQAAPARRAVTGSQVFRIAT